MMRSKKNILIIKFGGLGDFFLSLYAINSIKKFHSKDNLILLTEIPYSQIANKSGWFQKIITIKRSLFHFQDKIQIKKKINGINFDIVYDLQTSRRSSSYYSIFDKKKIMWSGIVKGCSLFHSNPNRNKIHTIERQEEQLGIAEIKRNKNIDINWLFERETNIDEIIKPFFIIAPGGSVKRKYKRIPVNIFIEIINLFQSKGLTPVIIGKNDETEICSIIQNKCDGVINLCNRVNIFELANLSKKAKLSIGNDTGPMHLFAIGGCKTIVLFTKHSDPKICAPRGSDVNTLIYDQNKTSFLEEIKKVSNN